MQAALNALNQHCTQLHQRARYLALCADAEVPQVFKELLDSLEKLFSLEHSLMEQHQFQALRCHVEQHARALRGLHRTHSLVMCGACHKGRYVGAHLLMHWFELHHETLDACLAAWLECLQSGRTILTTPRRALWPEITRESDGDVQVPSQASARQDKNNLLYGSGQDGQNLGN